MSPNVGTAGSGNDLTGALTGKELGIRLPALTSAQRLYLVPRSLVYVTMPPLALYVWQQLDYLTGKGSRLAGQAGLTSPRVARLPILVPTFFPRLGKSATHSSTWWRLLHLIWLRQRQMHRRKPLRKLITPDEGWPVSSNDMRRNELVETFEEPLARIGEENRWADELHSGEFLQIADISDEKRLVTSADELYPGELLETLHALQEKPLLTPANKLYRTVVRNLLSPPVAGVELPQLTYDLLRQTYATFMPTLPKQVIDQLEAEDTGRFTSFHISQDKIHSIRRSDLGYVKDAEGVLAQASSYLSPRLEKVWAPFAQRLALRRMPMKGLPHITPQSIRVAHTTPVWHQPYLTASRVGVEPGSPIAQQATLPYIVNIPDIVRMPEAVTLVERPIDTLENYTPMVTLEEGSNLVYSLPGWSEPAVAKAGLTSPSLSAIPRAARSLNELVSSLLPRDTLLPNRRSSQQVLEVSQAGWSEPLVKWLPETAIYGTDITDISGGMTHGPVALPVAPLANVSFRQSLETGHSKIPLVHADLASAVGLRQPSSITESIYQMPILPDEQYFKSAVSIPITESIYQTTALPYQEYFKAEASFPLPDKSASNRLVWSKDQEPAFPGYKDTRPSALEPLLTASVGPRTGSSATWSGGLLPPVFEGGAYYGGQLTPELALAPVERPAEVVSPPPTPELKAEETAEEAAAPDYDAIALEVYSILKKRLKRERERELGFA